MKTLEKQICDRSAKLKKYIEFKCQGNKELAEDLFQDTMLKILAEVKVEKLKNNSSLDSFMSKCAKTVISCYFKTEAIHKRLLSDDYVYCISANEKSYERNYEIKEEIKDFMRKAETQLGNTCRKIIMLLLFQNMNHFEIASTINKDRRTVSTHLLRMRKRLGNVHLNKSREIST